jgi:hypothetical protein
MKWNSYPHYVAENPRQRDIVAGGTPCQSQSCVKQHALASPMPHWRNALRAEAKASRPVTTLLSEPSVKVLYRGIFGMKGNSDAATP